MPADILPADLPGLLDQWAERHPNECRAVPAPDGGILGYRLLTDARPAGHFVSAAPGETDLWAIEGAARQAIIRRQGRISMMAYTMRGGVVQWETSSALLTGGEALHLSEALILHRLSLPGGDDDAG